MKHINFKSLIVLFLVLFGISPNLWAGKFVSDGTTRLYVQNMKPSGWSDDYWTGNDKWWIRVSNTSNFDASSAGTKSAGCVYTGSDGVYYVVVPKGEWQYFRVYRGADPTSTSWWNNTSVKTFDGDKNFMYSWDDGSSASFTNAMYDATFYFDNSSTNWSGTSQLWVGRGDHISCNTLTSITNTKLLYKSDMKYINYTRYGFCNVNYNGWNADIVSEWNKLSAGKSDLRSDRATGVNFISGGTTTTKTVLSSYTDLNKSQSVEIYVSTNGGTSYSNVTSSLSTYGSVNATYYYLSAASTASKKTDQNIRDASQNAVISSSITLSASANTGYTFKGFSNSSATTPSSTNTSYTYMVSDATTTRVYFAANTYTVTLDAQGGTGGSDNVTATYDAAMPSADMPTKNGYTFNGYYDAETGGTQYYNNTGASAHVWDKANDATLYAQWTEDLHSVTISYTNDKGSTLQATTTVNNVGITTAAEITAPDFAGNTFSEWELVDGVQFATGYTNKDNPTKINATADEKTIVAKYTKDASFSLTVKNGTHVQVVTGTTSPITLGESYTISATEFDNGYEFNNWTADPIANAIYENGDATKNPNSVQILNGSVIITANAKVSTYNITYAGVEGAINPNSSKTTYTIEEDDYTFKSASKTGYIFNGWTCGGVSITKLEKGVSYGDKIITAIWTPITYKVHFDGKGNTGGSMSDQDFTYDEASKPLTANAFIKTGYTFQGWDTNSAGTTVAYQDEDPVQNLANTQGAVVNLYAVWQAKTYTISFDDNGGTGGQTEPVTATYNQAMPALQGFTAPVKNGYEFMGYYSGDVQYYKANGTSARTWNIDGNTTLIAKWEEIHVYIEGRFRVRATAGGPWQYPGSNISNYNTDSRKIAFTFDEENNVYTLNTWAYVNELAGTIEGTTLNFHIAKCAGTGALTQIHATAETDNFNLNKKATSAPLGGSANLWFDDNTDFSGPVILTYNPTANTLSYTAAPEPTYTVTFIAGGRGYINDRSDVKEFTTPVGIRSGYNITANCQNGYRFEKWTSTGGVSIANARNASTSITVTGSGTVTANFYAPSRIYFQKPKSWVGDVYIYFYNGDYWNGDNGSGAQDTRYGAQKMAYDGKHYEHDVYYYEYGYDIEPLSWLSFATVSQDGQQYFHDASVSYRGDYNRCKPANEFIANDEESHHFNNHNSSYYNNGHWQQYPYGFDVDYYLKEDYGSPALEEFRFIPTSDANVRKMVWHNLTKGSEHYFRIWQTCDCSFGCTATINHNVDNYIFYTTNNDRCKFVPEYDGDYEFTWNTSTDALSVKYVADFYVRSFPQAVSVVKDGIYRIEPKVDLGANYNVTNLDVNVSVDNSSVATVTQSGYNILVTGVANGTTTGHVTYTYKGLEFDYNFTIVVGPSVTIQATIADGDTKWIYNNMVNIHYWLKDAAENDVVADVNMTYSDGYYSATLPLKEGTSSFKMMFWYGEEINLSATDIWRKTEDITLNVKNYCFEITHGGGVDAQRTYTKNDDGTLCQGDIYQVVVNMKNGKTYSSNIVASTAEDKTLSFFAPGNAEEETYKQGTIQLLKNGSVVKQTVTTIEESNVYTAILTIDGETAELSNITPYDGDFYVLSGLSSAEKDNASKMIEFTRQSGEAFSYYWVAFSNDCPSKNANATLANAYNDNLSIAIGSDKKTDSEGNVESGNVRFSYEPTTNEFKRAIIGGSTENPKFLALVGNNVYDTDGTTALDDAQYALEDTKCKFTDASDWVYEKNIKIKADGVSDAKVYIKAQFNGVLTELLGYEIDPTTGEETTTPKPLVVMGSATSAGTYDIRIIYDYKKNRLLSTWEPPEGEITQDMTIESDVLFVSQEDGDVKQVTIGDVTEGTPAKLTSLQNVMYVKEFSQTGTLKTYWMALPFDCRISDIYGIGGYGTVWRIQEYDGKTRAQNGWLNESQTFWRTMTMDDEMKAGYGYLLQIVRSKMEFHEIDGKAALRLYFPSKDKGFTMTRSAVGETKEYDVENCTIKGREAEDSNWKLMGPLAYNNIKVQEVRWDGSASQPTENNFPSYIYVYNATSKTYDVVLATDRIYSSFHAFMTQFGGTIEWQPYTETKHGQAPRFADLSDSFKGGRLSIELVQANEALDRTFVTLSQYGTEGFDQNKDLTKIAESRSTISTITNNVEYAGNTLPLDIEMVPLNVKVVANGTYDIAIEQSLEGLEVRLLDAFEQTTTVLDMMPATVTLDKGEYKDRFFLQFVQKSPLTPTNFNGTIEQFNLPTDKTQKLLINDNIYLINAGRVYNASGTKVR